MAAVTDDNHDASQVWTRIEHIGVPSASRVLSEVGIVDIA